MAVLTNGYEFSLYRGLDEGRQTLHFADPKRAEDENFNFRGSSKATREVIGSGESDTITLRNSLSEVVSGLDGDDTAIKNVYFNENQFFTSPRESIFLGGDGYDRLVINVDKSFSEFTMAPGRKAFKFTQISDVVDRGRITWGTNSASRMDFFVDSVEEIVIKYNDRYGYEEVVTEVLTLDANGRNFDDNIQAAKKVGFLKYEITDNNYINGSGIKERLKGSSKNDIITGLGGNDIIKAKSGDDIIDGGSGKDKLWGGSGADVFVLSKGKDKIKDFDALEGDTLGIDRGGEYDYKFISKGVKVIGEGSKTLVIGDTDELKQLINSMGEDLLTFM